MDLKGEGVPVEISNVLKVLRNTTENRPCAPPPSQHIDILWTTWKSIWIRACGCLLFTIQQERGSFF